MDKTGQEPDNGLLVKWTKTEATDLIHALQRACPGLLRWQEQAVAEAMRCNGSTEDEEYNALLREWFILWRGIQPNFLYAVIADLEQGKLQPPPFQEIGTFIRTEAKELQTISNYPIADERRLHCPRCQDRGLLHIWNPAYVNWLRQKFIEWGDDLPDGWFASSSREWRRSVSYNGNAPHHVALCNCDCPQQVVYEEELFKWQKGVDSERVRRGPPACGTIYYNPKHMLLCRTMFDWVDDLRGWYEKQEADQESRIALATNDQSLLATEEGGRLLHRDGGEAVPRLGLFEHPEGETDPGSGSADSDGSSTEPVPS